MSGPWEEYQQGAPAAPAPAAPAAPAPAAAPTVEAGPWTAYAKPAAPAAAPATAAPAATPADAAASPDRSLAGEIGHQVGLTARAAVQGAAALPGVVSDAITGPINAGLDKVAGEGNGFRFQKVSSALGNIMDQAGVAKPENATERVVQDIATGVGAAATGIGAGQALARAAEPVTAAVGNALAAAPGMQAISGAAGAGAAGITRESGGGEVAQVAAGLAGALAPTVAPFAARAATRGAIRGGEAGRQEMAERIKTFEDATGETPTLGQATGRRAVQAAETGLSNVVGGSGIMVRRGEAQAEAMQKSVQELTDALAPNATGADAGAAITRGVNAFKDNVKTVQGRLYGELDKYIPAESAITVNRTREALAALNEGIEGAPELSKWFRNARIQGIEGALRSDTEGTAAVLSRPGMKAQADAMTKSLTDEADQVAAANTQRTAQFRASLEDEAARITAANTERRTLGMRNLEPEITPAQMNEWTKAYAEANSVPVPTAKDIAGRVDEFLKEQVTGNMPYESIKKLRTLVGQEISNNSLVDTVPRSKWRALYAALSDDLGDAATSAGPQAQQAWARANTYTRSSMQRLEQLDSIVNRDAPEKIFKAATTGLGEGGTTINRLMKSLPTENRREVAAAVLQRLGRAKPGQQNEMGDAFSSETFLTNLASMSPAARRALFGSSGFPGLEQRINQMGAVANARREGSKVFANPSGTARQTALLGWLGGLMTSFASGNPVAIGGALAAPVIANAGARIATNPNIVRAISTPAELSPAAGPVAIAAAARPSTFEERKVANKERIQRMRGARP